jgi:hypothetical protein
MMWTALQRSEISNGSQQKVVQVPVEIQTNLSKACLQTVFFSAAPAANMSLK